LSMFEKGDRKRPGKGGLGRIHGREYDPRDELARLTGVPGLKKGGKIGGEGGENKLGAKKMADRKKKERHR